MPFFRAFCAMRQNGFWWIIGGKNSRRFHQKNDTVFTVSFFNEINPSDLWNSFAMKYCFAMWNTPDGVWYKDLFYFTWYISIKFHNFCKKLFHINEVDISLIDKRNLLCYNDFRELMQYGRIKIKKFIYWLFC